MAKGSLKTLVVYHEWRGTRALSLPGVPFSKRTCTNHNETRDLEATFQFPYRSRDERQHGSKIDALRFSFSQHLPLVHVTLQTKVKRNSAHDDREGTVQSILKKMSQMQQSLSVALSQST